MTLEELFYKEVCPEGKNNYVLSGQAKVLLMLCKAIDEMKAAQQSVQPTIATEPLEDSPWQTGIRRGAVISSNRNSG